MLHRATCSIDGQNDHSLNMREEIVKLLDLRRLPGRISQDQTSQVLGFSPHDVPVLVKARLLKPLGCPSQQAVKWFAAVEVERCATGCAWLDRASKALYQHWAAQNRLRAPRSSSKTISDGGELPRQTNNPINQRN